MIKLSGNIGDLTMSFNGVRVVIPQACPTCGCDELSTDSSILPKAHYDCGLVLQLKSEGNETITSCQSQKD